MNTFFGRPGSTASAAAELNRFPPAGPFAGARACSSPLLFRAGTLRKTKDPCQARRQCERVAGIARPPSEGVDRIMIFEHVATGGCQSYLVGCADTCAAALIDPRSEEHTSELQ